MVSPDGDGLKKAAAPRVILSEAKNLCVPKTVQDKILRRLWLLRMT